MIELPFGQSSVQTVTSSPEGTEELIEMARLSDLKRARHLLHKNHADQPQTMLILLERDSRVGMHRHPANKTEIYVILEGQLRVDYVDKGEQRKSRFLAPWGNLENLPTVSIHRDGIWHEPVAVSETVLYLEIYSGPFNKDYDVEYK